MQIPKFVNVFGKKIKIPQPTLKGFVGGLGRFLLIMMVVQPLLQKPMTKLCHKIFGEPKAYLKKQNESNQSVEETPSTKVQEQQHTQSFDVQNAQETNLLKRWTNTQAPETPVASTGIVDSGETSKDVKSLTPQEAVPAFNIFNKNKQDRYIPSIEPFVPQDNSAEINARVNSILKSTDGIVAKTKKYL